MANLVETLTAMGCARRSSLVRYIRIVEVRGSTPLCSTRLRSVELGYVSGRYALRISLKDS